MSYEVIHCEANNKESLERWLNDASHHGELVSFFEKPDSYIVNNVRVNFIAIYKNNN